MKITIKYLAIAVFILPICFISGCEEPIEDEPEEIVNNAEFIGTYTGTLEYFYEHKAQDLETEIIKTVTIEIRDAGGYNHSKIDIYGFSPDDDISKITGQVNDNEIDVPCSTNDIVTYCDIKGLLVGDKLQLERSIIMWFDLEMATADTKFVGYRDE